MSTVTPSFWHNNRSFRKRLPMSKMVAHSYCIMVLFLILNCHAGNTANVSDIRDECNTVEKYVAVVLFSLLLLYSIVSNVLLIFEFCRRDHLYNHSFVLITSQLIVCNLLISLLQILFILPEILQSKDSSGASNRASTVSIFSHMDTFLFTATLQFAFLLSISRFVTINLPKFHAIFESKKLIFLLCGVWLLAFAITAADFYYCTAKYCISDLRWYRNCTEDAKEGGQFFNKFYHFWTAFLPIAMFVVYIAIFCGIRHKRNFSLHNHNKRMSTRVEIKATKISSYEWSTLIQAALTCSFMEIEIVIFNFLPAFAVKLFGEKANISSRIFVNCCIILNCTILPTIHFICNKQARNVLKQKCLFLKTKKYLSTTS
uniref:G_PROTEIN_RECEP_F1_2 domain-containing protein n=2 Tax=Wuchereria bancrofti TaxID=6293 RepID=A0A1I8EH66_WUCBA